MSEKTYSEVMNDFRQHIGANEIVATDPEDVYAIEAKIGKKFADELDAAHKREVGALRQRCTELNAEVAAKDEVIKRLNDAIAEEQRRKMTTAEKSSAAGDAAKLREALTKVEEWMARRIATCGFGESATFPTMLEDVVLPALAAPPRNCDVGTAEEQANRFHTFCCVQHVCQMMSAKQSALQSGRRCPMEARRPVASDIEIDSTKDFEKKFNYRTADRCCANCKHGENEYEGGATCHHVERFDCGRDSDMRIMSYNVLQCDVCDAWEAKEVSHD